MLGACLGFQSGGLARAVVRVRGLVCGFGILGLERCQLGVHCTRELMSYSTPGRHHPSLHLTSSAAFCCCFAEVDLCLLISKLLLGQRSR